MEISNQRNTQQSTLVATNDLLTHQSGSSQFVTKPKKISDVRYLHRKIS